MILFCFIFTEVLRAQHAQPNYAQPLLRAFDSFFARMLQSNSRRGSSVVEQPIRNRQVVGSTPTLGSRFLFDSVN